MKRNPPDPRAEEGASMSLFIEEEGGTALPFDVEETARLVVEAALELENCPL